MCPRDGATKGFPDGCTTNSDSSLVLEPLWRLDRGRSAVVACLPGVQSVASGHAPTRLEESQAGRSRATAGVAPIRGRDGSRSCHWNPASFDDGLPLGWGCQLAYRRRQRARRPSMSRPGSERVAHGLGLLLVGLTLAGCTRDHTRITPTTSGTDLRNMPRGRMTPQPFPGSSLAAVRTDGELKQASQDSNLNERLNRPLCHRDSTRLSKQVTPGDSPPSR